MNTGGRIESSVAAVKQAILSAGLSKRALSERTGIPYTSLNRKLAGHTDLTLQELFLIAEATGVSPTQLIQPGAPKPPEASSPLVGRPRSHRTR